MSPSPAVDAEGQPAGMWSQLARARVVQLLSRADQVPRVAVLGPAGADKTPLLEWIRAGLAAAATSGPGRTLIVDDAHTLGEDEIAALERHLDHEDAGLVLAARPWPRSDALRGLVRRLEQSAPAIVVGRLDVEDVMAAVRTQGLFLDETCARSLVTLTGSITWLVKEALVAHGDGPCDDPSHARVVRAVGEVVAERLTTMGPDDARMVRRAALSDRLGGDVAVDVAGDGRGGAGGPDGVESSLARGHSEGMLQRNGEAPPIVRAAALTTTPLAQLVALLGEPGRSAPPIDLVRSLGDIADPRVAQALLTHADAVAADDDLGHAIELYEAARDAGADPLQTAVRVSRLAWDRGELTHAAATLDAIEIPEDHPEHDAAVDLAGSAWSARGYPGVSAATYLAHELTDPVVRSHAAVAALASGEGEPLHDAGPGGPAELPTTLSVSARLLLQALRASLSDQPEAALEDAIRASDTYAQSHYDGPAPELPAVMAAIIAIGTGELDTARGILADALMTGHGGAWARPRLLLWAAWVAVHAQQPEECAARLAEVDASIAALGPRDIVVRDAVLLAFMRRYGVHGELQALWERVREDARGIEPDLFSLLPLSEFIVTAAEFDDTALLERVGESIGSLLSGLGAPPLWSALPLWTAFQQAVLADDLAAADERATRLQALAPGTPVARAVASAASEWLRARRDESIDVGRVVEVATELAAVGFAWDAARLAHLAASAIDGRKASNRLIALAHHLHPNAERSSDVAPRRAPRVDDLLSAREREVAALVIAGKTYAEVGEAMFISPRTAEHHIARIRRRLGATSRADLIVKLRAIVEFDDD